MEETILLLVKVKINYTNKKGKKEAIKLAKQRVVCASVLGETGCVPKSAKLFISK